MIKIENSCPLCHACSVEFSRDQMRPYFVCSRCTLVFVSRHDLISPLEEHRRYLAHQNSENDERYRAYLERTVAQILPVLGKRQRGLDFGCGDSILLERIFSENGREMDSYDVYFRPDESIWEKKYQFIVLSEVIEHLREPLFIMKRLKERLEPGGIIFIKTMMRPDCASEFANWYYKRDETHIQFFNDASMGHLAIQLSMQGPFKTALKDLTYIID